MSNASDADGGVATNKYRATFVTINNSANFVLSFKSYNFAVDFQTHEDYIQLTCIKSSLAGGAFYTVQGLQGWDTNPHAIREKELWLCPVTLCVLGHYPKFIYVRE